jgi:hypothetical protein
MIDVIALPVIVDAGTAPARAARDAVRRAADTLRSIGDPDRADVLDAVVGAADDAAEASAVVWAWMSEQRRADLARGYCDEHSAGWRTADEVASGTGCGSMALYALEAAGRLDRLDDVTPTWRIATAF